ncbi:hypothetical protein PR048_028288 [Dryococelus australis]|uniref:Uncharacterized protein n=1 Tax=Dryococelus australis TaxID=614101 RepID=A0ABQ9GIV8_9NEOP|nr:hypothetical protein PR048_028288 [Dryococelus australis]
MAIHLGLFSSLRTYNPLTRPVTSYRHGYIFLVYSAYRNRFSFPYMNAVLLADDPAQEPDLAERNPIGVDLFLSPDCAGKDNSPLTKVKRVRFPAGSPRIFACGNCAEQCRSSADFLADFQFSPPWHSGAATYSLTSPPSALKTFILVRSHVVHAVEGRRNASQAEKLPRERYPDKTPPFRRLFSRLVVKLREAGDLNPLQTQSSWSIRGGSVQCPARTPDLNNMDFSLWGYLTSDVYRNIPTTPDNMQERVVHACNALQQATLEESVLPFIQRLNVMNVRGDQPPSSPLQGTSPSLGAVCTDSDGFTRTNSPLPRLNAPAHCRFAVAVPARGGEYGWPRQKLALLVARR